MAISSSLSAQSISQSGWQQFRVQQAQREAEQAERNAATLQGQAADARRNADRADENARSLEVQSTAIAHALSTLTQSECATIRKV